VTSPNFVDLVYTEWCFNIKNNLSHTIFHIEIYFIKKKHSKTYTNITFHTLLQLLLQSEQMKTVPTHALAAGDASKNIDSLTHRECVT